MPEQHPRGHRRGEVDVIVHFHDLGRRVAILK